MKLEDEYMDVLQNLEAAVVILYRGRPEMTDYEVMRAYEALIDDYRGEQIGRQPKERALSPLEREVLDSVRQMCEIRLGRIEPSEGMLSAGDRGPEPIAIDALILCLKRLLKSAEKSNRTGGVRGYLDFVSQYIR